MADVLPEDMWMEIRSHLGRKDRAIFNLSCKAFRKQDRLWRYAQIPDQTCRTLKQMQDMMDDILSLLKEADRIHAPWLVRIQQRNWRQCRKCSQRKPPAAFSKTQLRKAAPSCFLCNRKL